MKKFFPILSSLSFLLFLVLLVILKVRHYDFNLSSMIGIWTGFMELNPGYIPEGFVVFQEGGYDGQFFFLLSRYIFESDALAFPILDSFYFRFHRLGLSLLVGFPLKFVGIEYYSISTLILLSGFHLAGFYFLYDFLPYSKKKYSLLFLFNPYSILGILLLVSDPLLISLGLISSLMIYQVKYISYKNIWILFLAMCLFSLSLLVRETSLFLIAPILLFSIAERKYFKIPFLLPPVVLYIGFLVFTQNWDVPNPGTSPLKFLDMVDYPLFGFVKSWEFSEGFSFKQLAREGVKFFLFILYVQLVLNLWNIVREWKANDGMNFEFANHRRTLALFAILLPVIATLGIITIAEQGYWRSFDNLARMFTIVTPIIIIAKSYFARYKDFGFLYLSMILTVFLVVRIGIITKPMKFFLAE